MLKRLKQSLARAALATCMLLPSMAGATETVTYFHNDPAGNPIAAMDATGAVIWKENYLPYGEQAGADSPAKANNEIWFHGKPHDQSTGLSYFQARYYDPMAGRFMGIDPVGFNEANIHSFNRYAYGNNNPYRYTDPDGRESLSNHDTDMMAMFVMANSINGGAAGLARPILSWLGMEERAVAAAATSVVKTGVQANKAAGDAFERQVMGQIQQTQSGVVQQVTVKTASGVKTRIDLMGRDAKGNIACTECKASATAPLTKNQAKAFPEIQQSGGVVVGKGKPGFPGGTQIPPTAINIVRP